MNTHSTIKGFLLTILMFGFNSHVFSLSDNYKPNRYVKMYYGCYDDSVKKYRLCSLSEYIKYVDKKTKFCFDTYYEKVVPCKYYLKEVNI